MTLPRLQDATHVVIRHLAAVVALCAAVVLVAPAAPANASAFLSKSRARAKAVSVARDLYLGVDDLTGYSVESPTNCSRLSAPTVKCDLELYDDMHDIQCDDAVIVSLKSHGFLSIRFPHEPHCYSVGTSPAPPTTPTSPTTPTVPTTPMAPTLPTGPTPPGGVIPGGNGYPVVCADGTISNSGGIQGACSHHGGVA